MPLFLSICTIGTLAAVLIAARDTMRWARRRGPVSVGQLITRWLSALTIGAITALIAVGQRVPMERFVVGWLACILLIPFLIVLAAVDLRQVMRAHQRNRERLLKHFSADMKEALQKAATAKNAEAQKKAPKRGEGD